MDGFSRRFQEAGQAIDERGLFVGCPLQDFERISRDQLVVLLKCGLTPWSKVLDIGCGCLRAGSWLAHFLDDKCYHGVEPNQAMLQAGLEEFVPLFELKDKVLRFSSCDSFKYEDDHQISGWAPFNFFTGLSIWSHASREQILRMLDSFVALSVKGGKMVMSYFPSQSHGYLGDGWVGRSHESDTPGVIQHSRVWLVKECGVRDLTLRDLDEKILGQQWVCIERK